MLPSRYIRVSEVNTFLYCRRAWYLGRRGVRSSLEPERDSGIAYHRAHGELVHAAQLTARISTWFGAACVLLFVVFALLVLR